MSERAPVSLWTYAVEIYALAGVKDQLLTLQDRYRLDVHVLLWCIWCGRYGYGFEADEVDEMLDEVSAMSLHAVRPLRSVRVFLSSPREGYVLSALEGLRQRVLEMEIAAEELVLRRLGQLSEQRGSPSLELSDMLLRAERLFTLAREAMDRPTMIADEEGPLSPAALFREVCRRAEEDGP